MKPYKKQLHILYTIVLIWVFFFIPAQAMADPTPDIKLNGSDGPITVNTGTNVNLTVKMAAGTALGNTADYFVVQQDQNNNLTSFGPLGTWVPGIVSALQGPLFDFSSFSLFNSTLAEGNHTFYFGVDQTPDGLLSFPLDFDLAMVTVQSLGTPVPGDYGDAPDGGATGYPSTFAQTGGFPTLFSSNGARTLSTTDAVLGITASVELDASDTTDPDGVANLGPVNTDSDDAITNFFLLLTSIPPPATLSIIVNGPATGAGGDFFINVLIDLDMDGSWGGAAGNGEPEWVIKNHAVTVTPGMQATITPPAFAFANGLILPDGAWMRIALTRESITDTDWNGSGEFSSGEIEDHTISLPDLDGKKHPILTVDCGGPYRFGGAGAIPVTCTVTNWRRDAGGTFDWTVGRVSGGGVDVNAKSGGPVAVTAAPGAGSSVGVGLIATRIAGDLPSTWKFTAFPDPEAVITDGGVILGHGESAINFDFLGQEAGEFYVDGIEGGFVHFDGFSEVNGYIHLFADSPEIIEGATVSVGLLIDGEHLETKNVQVDASGNANVTFTIFRFGNYTLKVLDGYGNGSYNPALNLMDSVGVTVN